MPHECLTLHEFVRGSQSNFLAFSIRGLTACSRAWVAKRSKTHPCKKLSSAVVPAWRGVSRCSTHHQSRTTSFDHPAVR